MTSPSTATGNHEFITTHEGWVAPKPQFWVRVLGEDPAQVRAAVTKGRGVVTSHPTLQLRAFSPSHLVVAVTIPGMTLGNIQDLVGPEFVVEPYRQ